MTRHFYTQLIIIMSAVFLLVGCRKELKVSIPKNDSASFSTEKKVTKNPDEKRLQNFIETKMVQKKGIYTNYRNYPPQKEVATGHEMLSESSGLWLEHLARTHQNRKFVDFYQRTKKSFDLGAQFSYRLNPSTNKKSKVNATLDDLRIIRALQMYAQNAGSKKYRREAAKRFALLQTTSIQKDRVLNFYDVSSKKRSNEGSLSYYDLLTLRYFESTSKAGEKDYQKQVKLIENGYLGDIFPLYYSSYNWSTKQYSNSDLNTSEALVTLLHLSEVHKIRSTSLDWLKMQIDDQHLYNRYSISGVVQDRNQSAANYALAAMIFANQNNQDYYKKAINLALKGQVKDKNSKIYGAIGDLKTNDAYSFNNLLTLIASEY